MMKLMTGKMKVIVASGISVIALLLISWGVYAKPVHAALVNYSNMVEVAPIVYVEPDMSKELQDQLLNYVELAQEKIAAIFGERTSTPYLIVALNSKSLRKYTENPTGQTYYLPWNNYIVIGPDGFNENVISHEFTHAELRVRLRNRNVVPVWFDEGLASMADGRLNNSSAIWEQVTDKGKKNVDYGLLDSYDAFRYGTPEAWKNYNLACYEVTRWFSIAGDEGLLKLIQALNQGEDFAEQYERIANAQP